MDRLVAARPGVLVGTLNAGLGVVLVLGSPARTSGPSFKAPMAVMPAWAWGLLFLTGALVCLGGIRWGRRGAYMVAFGAGIHAFWALSLTLGAALHKEAGLTGPVIYWWAALLHMIAGMRLARQAG